MTLPSGPRESGRPSANGHVPDLAAMPSPSRPSPSRPSPRPGPPDDREAPTEQVPVIDVEPSSPTRAQPVVGPLFEVPTGAPVPPHRAPEPATEAVPVIGSDGYDPEPPTEAVALVRPEPPTAAVKVIPADLFTQHLPSATASAVAEPAAGKPKRRLPVDLGPGALRRTWRASQPPKALRRAFLAALLAPAVHIVTIVSGLVFVAVAYGSYSLGTVLGGNLLDVAGWLVAALVALWVGVQARAGRLWAAIVLVVLAVLALVVTVDLALGTLTWIGLSGVPGVVRLVLLVIAALLCLAVPSLMAGPLRRGYFRQPAPDR